MIKIKEWSLFCAIAAYIEAGDWPTNSAAAEQLYAQMMGWA